MNLRNSSWLGGVISAALNVALSACQSTPEVPQQSTGNAVVRAYGGGAANWLAVTLKPIGEAHEVSFHTINGHDIKQYGNERQILLTPGHYDITVHCIFIVDNRQLFSDGQLAVDVVADHRYTVDAGLSPQGPAICAARLVDMTTG